MIWFCLFFQTRKSRIASNGPKTGENLQIKSTCALIITFLCCNILSGLLYFLDGGDIFLQDISQCLMTLNCSINMIVRPIFSEKFKEFFFRQYCSCFKTQYSISNASNCWFDCIRTQNSVWKFVFYCYLKMFYLRKILYFISNLMKKIKFMDGI